MTMMTKTKRRATATPGVKPKRCLPRSASRKSEGSGTGRSLKSYGRVSAPSPKLDGEKAILAANTKGPLPSPSTKKLRSEKASNKMNPPRALPSERTLTSRSEKAVPLLKTVQLMPSDRFQNNAEGNGQAREETRLPLADPSAILLLRELNAELIAYISAMTCTMNQTKAIVRRFLGFQTGHDEQARKKIVAASSAIVSAFWKGKVAKGHEKTTERVYRHLAIHREAWGALDVERTATEKLMKMEAAKLPAFDFVKSVRGFGELSLARIIGECGDLANYSNPGKLWKRMGLAPYNGKAASTWRKGMEGKLQKEDWEKIGYSPARRSVMFVVGDVLMKSNRGYYKQVYDDRKAYELARDPSMKKIRAHRRAQRYMEKRLLLHLWVAWRKAIAAKSN